MCRAQAADRVDRIGGDVEIERRAQAAERRPFGHRFEGIDRLDGFDFDGPLELASALLAEQQEIGVHGNRPDFY